MKINVSIVEDNPRDAKRLAGYLDDFFKKSEHSYSVEFFTGGLTFIDKYEPRFDIIFMDIEMPGMDGMEAAARLRKVDKEVLLYFVTNMAQFAARGYDVEASGFLIKPVTYESIALKLVKAVALLKQKVSGTIVIGSKTKFFKVNTAEIKYIEIRGHTLTWHTLSGEYVSTGSLVHLESQLGSSFAFCNQCYLVNMRYCDALDGNEVSVCGEKLQISRYKKAEFLNKLNKYVNGAV